MPRARAEVAGEHFLHFCRLLHFRLPALALNIPPRIALVGWFDGCGLGDVDQLCVGAGLCARPFGIAVIVTRGQA